MSEQVTTIVEYAEDIAEAVAPDPLPARDYPAEIRTAEIKTSANTGNRYYSLGIFVAPENYPADYNSENAPDGRTFMYNLLSAEDTPNARYRLKKFLESVGLPMSKRIDVNEWIGQGVTVELKHGQWQGEVREEVAKIKAAA